MKKLLCYILGHKDPVFSGIGFISQEELYENWKTWIRSCERCGKDLTKANLPQEGGEKKHD